MHTGSAFKAERAPFAEVGGTLRRVLAKATAARLNGTQWRVLAAVIALTASYSKYSDQTYVAKIAELADLDKNDESLKRTKRVLKHLAREDLIQYNASRRHGEWTVIGLGGANLGGGET